MSTRRLAFCAAVGFLACSCSTLGSRSPTQASPASQYEAAIGRLERSDPASPASLDAQLAYAGFLLSGSRSSCGDGLTLAQEQIGSVAANPKTRVMFPDGWALVADLEYRQHLARAGCVGSADRRDELLAAVDAARRAVTLYRNEFDYHSMVVMQFDTAATLHQLGEEATALAALEAALRMDREYGFRDDARENYQLLLTWQGEPAGAAQVASLMHDFPRRRVTLKFGWHPADARIVIDRRRTCLSDGQIAQSRASAAFVGHITADDSGGWAVSYTDRLSAYDPGVWPSEQSHPLPQLAFAPAALVASDFKVSAIGGFGGVTDSKAFAARLSARTVALIRAGGLSSHDRAGATKDALETAAGGITPGALEAQTAESYQLGTAMWIGATLEQGVWYEMSAPLLLQGPTRYVVPQRIEFAFTRLVPCTDDAGARKCVELVIHATPDQKTLKNLLADLLAPSPSYRYSDFAASTDARIVVDPATLLPYAREERIYWYVSLGMKPGEKILQSEHLVSTTRYDAPAAQAADRP
jgi:tetratricopeptide (TPR) repeat protein